jgi:hypothetical protein
MAYPPRRISYAFLCMVPVLAVGVAAPRALRVSGIYQIVGAMLFAAIVIAASILGARAFRAGAEGKQRLALAGGLLLTPFALVALLWVGLGPPWDASQRERDALSRPAYQFGRRVEWICGSQGGAQRSR